MAWDWPLPGNDIGRSFFWTGHSSFSISVLNAAHTARYSPKENRMAIEKENLPELNEGFIKSLKVLGKVNAQIAHVNDEGIWEV